MSRFCWGMAISDLLHRPKEGERGQEGQHGGWHGREEEGREVQRVEVRLDRR
jgi:hypothetical protein